MALEAWGIAVLSGILGAGITQGVTEWRERKHSGRHKAYSALRVALSLEDFAYACASEMSDIQTHEASDGADGAPYKGVPAAPVFADDVDFRLLPAEYVERALRFSAIVHRAESSIAHEIYDGPDVSMDAIAKCLAVAGVEALQLADAFRATGGVARRTPLKGAWNFEAVLKNGTMFLPTPLNFPPPPPPPIAV
jgi:hypothetical protein